MKVLLKFRPTPTFVTATTMLSLAILFCALVTSVSAAPQFGRPLLHALDESPAGLGLGSLTDDPSVSSLPGLTPTALPIVTPGTNPSERPTAGCTTQARAPELEVDPVNVSNPTESPTTIVTTPTLVQTNTNGAPTYLLGGVNVAIVTVLSVATSAVFIFF